MKLTKRLGAQRDLKNYLAYQSIVRSQVCTQIYLHSLSVLFSPLPVKLDPFYASIILFVGRAWDGVTDPIVGFLVSRSRWTRFGRMMPWYVSLPFLNLYVENGEATNTSNIQHYLTIKNWGKKNKKRTHNQNRDSKWITSRDHGCLVTGRHTVDILCFISLPFKGTRDLTVVSNMPLLKWWCIGQEFCVMLGNHVAQFHFIWLHSSFFDCIISVCLLKGKFLCEEILWKHPHVIVTGFCNTQMALTISCLAHACPFFVVAAICCIPHNKEVVGLYSWEASLPFMAACLSVEC